MTFSSKRFGASSGSIQLAAIAVYLVLLVHQHKVSNDALGHHLLAISVKMTLVGAVMAIIGLFADEQKLLSLISLLATLPILLVMAGWQGIS